MVYNKINMLFQVTSQEDWNFSCLKRTACKRYLIIASYSQIDDCQAVAQKKKVD